MSKYNHITEAMRQKIEAMLIFSPSQKHVAKAIGISEGGLSLELKRNRHASGTYSAEYAEAQARKRRKGSKTRTVLTGKVLEYIETKLKEYWSPDQISNAGKLELSPVEVSVESIYEYIYLPENKTKKLWKYLRRSRPKRKKKSQRGLKRKGCNIPNRKSIHKRPEAANQRSRIGDFEGDSVVGPRSQNDGAIATFNDRASGFLLIGKMERKCKKEMFKAAIHEFDKIPKNKRLTLTLDNGTEFTCHEAITEVTGLECYFADPYSSWQRGSNENTNGLIRQFLPKGMSLKEVTQEQLDRIAFLINNRPRKRLAYRTPLEVFFDTG
jgi:IS30 family transposase